MKKGDIIRFVGVFILFIVIAMFLNAQPAHALATLKLSDGSTIITIEDNDSYDINDTIGEVSYSGSIGSFGVNVTTGVTYPVLGSIDYPVLDLNDISVTTSGAGSLTIMFSETGFGPSGSTGIILEAAGTTNGTVSFSSYLGTDLFQQGTLLGSLSYSTSPFDGSASTTTYTANPYSLTAVATITHNGAGQATSFNYNTVVVPEPISSALFVVGGALLGFRRFRKTKKS